MASVYKRVRERSGKPDLVTWEARWRAADGRQRRKSFTKKSDAERYRAAIETRMGDGSYVDPSDARVTVGWLAERWLAPRIALKPKTVAGYRGLLDTRVLPRWRDVPLNRIRYEDVNDWVSEMAATLSASRTRQAYFALTAILDYAVKARRLTSNPARGAELPRIPKSTRRYLTADQVWALTAACGEGGDVVLTLAFTGIRWGELAGLRVRDVETGVRRIHIAQAMSEVNGKVIFGPPKTHEDRHVSVPPFLRDRIAARMAGKSPDDLVFTTRRGTVLRVNNWRRAHFDRAAASVGLAGLVPHELRHTAASLAISTGANIKDVQNMLGHASAAMTLDRYGHLMDEAGDRLAERMGAEFGAPSQCVPNVSPGTVTPIRPDASSV